LGRDRNRRSREKGQECEQISQVTEFYKTNIRKLRHWVFNAIFGR
jgi:hypothetical protein